MQYPSFPLSTNLTKGPGRLKPSESAPVLQYGSGPSSDFLAKISGIDTPLFVGSEVLTAMSTKMAVFWVVARTSETLVNFYHSFFVIHDFIFHFLHC
jgi:hypothetical protein